MPEQTKSEILELGETFVMLLKSPICPPEVRAAIIGHLDHVRQQLDMTNPELVRSVFSFLASTAHLPANDLATTQAQGQAISSVLAAAATAKTGELAAPAPVAVKAEEPMAMAASTSATPAAPVAQPAAAAPPEPARTTGRNLASRLEDR